LDFFFESHDRWADSVKVYIETQTSMNGPRRYFLAHEDCKAATQLLQSLATVVDFFMVSFIVQNIAKKKTDGGEAGYKLEC
jgi:hypothetical protein